MKEWGGGCSERGRDFIGRSRKNMQSRCLSERKRSTTVREKNRKMEKVHSHPPKHRRLYCVHTTHSSYISNISNISYTSYASFQKHSCLRLRKVPLVFDIFMRHQWKTARRDVEIDVLLYQLYELSQLIKIKKNQHIPRLAIRSISKQNTWTR